MSQNSTPITTEHKVDFSQLAYAIAEPNVTATFKRHAEDFQVQEQNPYTLSGEGEHLWLYLQKSGENTEWLANEIAKWAGVKRAAIGVAGQKDRHAVTSQWMSVHLPGMPDPDWSSWPHPQVKLLKQTRHNRKLQKGGLSGNHFVIRLRELQTLDAEQNDFAQMVDKLTERLENIQQNGIPNYYGEQRFGKGGNNLSKAVDMIVNNRRVPRNKRSLYLSALRSWTFNIYLSERVADGSWNRYISGEVFQLDGSSRCFLDDASDNLPQRVEEGDIHPTGLLIGGEARGLLQPEGKLLLQQEKCLKPFVEWGLGLAKLRVDADRRALRLMPKSVQWQWLPTKDDKGQDHLDLQLEFTLPAGAFATMVLREILLAVEPKRIYPEQNLQDPAAPK